MGTRQAKASKLKAGEPIAAFGSCNYASDVSGVSESYIRRMCREHRIPAAKVGRAWRIDIPGMLIALDLTKEQPDTTNNVTEE